MTPWELFMYYGISGFVLAIAVDFMVKPVALAYRFIVDTLDHFIK